MEAMTENKGVPTLRFREFSDSYEEYKLSQLLNRYSEKNKDEEFKIDDILSLSSKYGIVDRKTILGDTYDKVNHLAYIKTRYNDFVYGKSISSNYPFGLFKANKCRDGLLSTLYFTFKVSNLTTSDYLDCYFRHLNRTNNFLKQFVIVGDRYITADANFLLSGEITIPTLPEQKKIATFLSLVDEKLQQLTKKKSLLADYKKGIMQKIFSQELRFKDANGNNYPDWEEKKLGELFEFKQGVQCGVESQYFESKDGLIRFIRIVDLTKDEESIRFIEDPGSSHHISFDDLFMVRYGNVGCVGYGYEGVLANNLFRIIPKNKTVIHNNFFHFVFKFKQRQFELLASTSTMPALNFTSLKTLKLKLPKLEEQKKIANLLSALDAKIEAVSTQINNTQAFKKGLLQQMFV